MSSAGDSRARLASLTKGFTIDWERTKESWRDAKGQEFEATYIVPLQAAVESSLTVIEELDKVLRKVKKDCE